MSYFDWLVLTIAPDYFQREGYSELLFFLYYTEFYWVVRRDRNRAEDGLDLRERYEHETGLYCDLYGPCNVLEMLVALAIRCENDLMYMYDPELGNQTSRWFWMFLENLGLLKFDDGNFEPDEISDILFNFMDRNYGFHGEFCAFSDDLDAENYDPEFEKIELAYQMNYYIKEKFY